MLQGLLLLKLLLMQLCMLCRLWLLVWLHCLCPRRRRLWVCRGGHLRRALRRHAGRTCVALLKAPHFGIGGRRWLCRSHTGDGRGWFFSCRLGFGFGSVCRCLPCASMRRCRCLLGGRVRGGRRADAAQGAREQGGELRGRRGRQVDGPTLHGDGSARRRLQCNAVVAPLAAQLGHRRRRRRRRHGGSRRCGRGRCGGGPRRGGRIGGGGRGLGEVRREARGDGLGGLRAVAVARDRFRRCRRQQPPGDTEDGQASGTSALGADDICRGSGHGHKGESSMGGNRRLGHCQLRA
mmetsp:Transcript_101208/g.325154  ORF Transcript_101208/g.325154 Transcript_101208/m.325154 type:complete len:293 (+) Transcript_101208:1175-2053(+)